MLKVTVAAFFAGIMLAAMGFAVWSSQRGDAAGILTNRRLIIPGIAMDSQPQSSSAGSVVVRVEMTRNEPALTGSGTTLISLSASASGPLPAPGGPAVTAPASLSIGTHPGDICTWNIEGASGSLVVMYSRLAVSGIRLTFGVANDISWYYMVQCPGSPPPTPVRFPAAPVDESLRVAARPLMSVW